MFKTILQCNSKIFIINKIHLISQKLYNCNHSGISAHPSSKRRGAPLPPQEAEKMDYCLPLDQSKPYDFHLHNTALGCSLAAFLNKTDHNLTNSRRGSTSQKTVFNYKTKSTYKNCVRMTKNIQK